MTMIHLETNVDCTGVVEWGGSTSPTRSSASHSHHQPQHLLHSHVPQETTSSTASIFASDMTYKSPKHPSGNPTSPPPLPYRSTGSTASVTTPSNSGHSRESHSSHKSDGTIESRNRNHGVPVSSHSSLAMQAIAQGKYQQAYEYYQLALQEYLIEETSVVGLVNAAATSFNLGALAKKLKDYPQAARYFCQAQDMYHKSSNLVNQHIELSAPMSKSISPSSSCQVCLLQLLVETLQARAHLHYKYQSLMDDAITCHKAVVELLEQNERAATQKETVFQRIHFIPLSQEGRWNFLVTSLQSLGKVYVERGKVEDAIDAYHSSLSILRKIDKNSSTTSLDQRHQEVSHILGALADIFMQTHSDTRDVVQLERLARLQEDLNNYERALNCWERILYCQSQEFGEGSVQVSVALGSLAHVMMLEGNLEGSVDLYRAAANLHLKNNVSLPEGMFSEILYLYKELDQLSSALTWLKAMLSRSEQREEQARIQYELGKIYLEQGIYHAAADSLCLSAELFDGQDEKATDLLQKVELLQNRASLPGVQAASTNFDGGALAAITEDGESTLAYESDFTIDEALKSINATLTEDSNNNDEQPADTINIDTLMEKAKSMEGERLDALVNSTTHALVSDIHFNPETCDRLLKQAISESPSSGITSYKSQMKRQQDAMLTTEVLEDRDRFFSVCIVVEDESLKNHLSVIQTEESIFSKLTEKTEPSFSSSPEGTKDLQSKSNELFSEPINAPSFDSQNQFYDESVLTEEKSTLVQDITAPDFNNTSKGAIYQSFQGGNNSTSHPADSPLSGHLNPTTESQDTPSPIISTTSLTGLLNPAEKSRTRLKSLNVPHLSSPTRSTRNKVRKGYTEVTEVAPTQRRRIVRALASPFRRSRSKSRSSTCKEFDPIDEVNEARPSKPLMETPKSGAEEEPIQSHVEAPVSFIALRERFDDDDAQSLVSQITFRMEEPVVKKNQSDGQWWWGVTAEGFEGWFPSSYVHQAVEAAEGFLSAKAIHDRVKSRPLDFDSDDDSECGEPEEEVSVVRDGSSRQSKTNSGLGSFSKPAPLSSQKRKISTGSSAAKPSNASGSVNAVNASRSDGSKMQAINQKIADKVIRLETTKSLHGPNSIHAARVLFELAELYNKNGDAEDALEYCAQALDIQKTTLHLSEASQSLHFMADMHSKERRYKEALSCYSEAQKLEEVLFGYFHEETASTLNRIGNVQARQGEFDLAMENHKEALRILKECCGEDVKHPLVSQTLIQIGAVYYKERNSLATIQSKFDVYSTFIEGGMLEIIGRAHEDRGSYRMAIAFFEEKLQFLNDADNSNDLEDVAETLNSLGMLSCRAGLYLEAIDYYDRALGIQMKLGCDEVQLAMAKVLAGSVQHSLGHYCKALTLFQDALDTLLENVGIEQETVAACLFHMGVVRAAQCNYNEAMSNLQDALEIQSKLLGVEHPATLRTRREIGNLYSIYEAELDAALEEFYDVIKVQKSIHGDKHPNVAETLHSIGCSQAKKGDLQAALRTLEECYNMRLEFLGMDHPQQATTLLEIAKILLKRNRLKKALHVINAALNIRIESLSEQHIDVALAVSTKASCLVARGNFTEANTLFETSLPVAEEAVGDNHPYVASIYVQKGVMHLRMCDFDKASASIRRALEIYKECDLDDDHPGIKEAMEELERVERSELLCV